MQRQCEALRERLWDLRNQVCGLVACVCVQGVLSQRGIADRAPARPAALFTSKGRCRSGASIGCHSHCQRLRVRLRRIAVPRPRGGGRCRCPTRREPHAAVLGVSHHSDCAGAVDLPSVCMLAMPRRIPAFGGRTTCAATWPSTNCWTSSRNCACRWPTATSTKPLKSSTCCATINCHMACASRRTTATGRC